VEELSGGEQQRVWLAFGLAHAKSFLMLDETLEGMDIIVKRAFFQLLKDIAMEDKGILLASHDLALVTEFADKVIVLNNGTVSYEGPPKENLKYFLSPSNG
jgi:ABC-type Mn2+/Zn2+ transport system ATPase subunit